MENQAEILAVSHAEGINIDESFVSWRIKKCEEWIIKIAFSNFRCHVCMICSGSTLYWF